MDPRGDNFIWDLKDLPWASGDKIPSDYYFRDLEYLKQGAFKQLDIRDNLFWILKLVLVRHPILFPTYYEQ